MIPLQNDRNISLLSTLPRLVSTSVTIESSAGSAFVKRKNGAPIDPVGINLTATTTVFTSPTYTWSYANSTAPGTWVAVGSNNKLLSITSANFLTHLGTGISVTYKVVVTQTGFTTAETVFNISYIVEADEPVIVEVIRDTTSVPAAADGTVSSFTNTGNTLRVKRGNTYLTYGTTGANTWNVSAAVSPAGSITLGALDTTTDTTKATYGNISTLTDDNAAVTYTIIVRDGSGNPLSAITKTQTYSKSKSGVIGKNGVAAYLTNPTHDLLANSAGEVYSSEYTSAVTTFKIVEGGSDVSGSWAFTLGTPQPEGNFAVSQNTNTFTVTSLTADSGYVDITATKTDYSPIVLRFSVTRLSKPLDGVSPQIVNLTANYQAVNYDKDGANPNPTGNITLTAKSKNTGTATMYYKFTVAGVVLGEGPVASNNGTATATYAIPANYFDTPKTAKVEMSATSGGAVIDDDTLSIVATKVGATGSTGLPGTDGKKTTILLAYKWSNTAISSAPAKEFTYTWGTPPATDDYPTGWAGSASAAPGNLYTLYTLALIATDAATATTTTLNWQNATVNVYGYRQDGSPGGDGDPGADGASAVRAYKLVYGTSLPSAPDAPSGAPNTATSWSGTSSGLWYAVPPTSVAPNEWLFQADGTKSVYGTYTWTSPTYLATFRVGSLDALTANIGIFSSQQSGPRVVIMDDKIQVYDSGGLRVQLGNLS